MNRTCLGRIAPILALAIVATSTALADPPSGRLDPEPLPDGIPFDRYFVTDRSGRTVTYYLSKTATDAKPLPLVLYCQGSGCQSAFTKHEGRASSGIQGFLLHVAKGRACVAVVEKPGVQFLDSPAQPGSSEEGSEEYLRNCTPQSWADANVAALAAMRSLPQIDARRVLVLGLSEGGQIAARIAADDSGVSHVSILSCGGPTQLFDALLFASRPQEGDAPGDAASRRQAVVDEWKKIQADPDSIEKFWMGHPYRRWSSFLQASTTDDLLRTKARIFIAHGTEDSSVPVESHDAMQAELLARARDVTAERLEGLDHSFQPKDADPQRGSVELMALVDRIFTWFLADKTGEAAGAGRKEK